MTKQEEYMVYKKRQTVLLFVIGTVFTIGLITLLVFLLTLDIEPIKPPDTLNAAYEDDIPADIGGGSVTGTFGFDMEEITVTEGESRIVEVIDKTGSQGNYFWESSDISVAFAEDGVVTGVSEGSCDVTVKLGGTNRSAKLRVYVEAKEPENEHETEVINGCTYIDGILIANKSYSLPPDFDPGLDREALAAFEQMASDAADEGLYLEDSSDYRSYYDQERIYNRYVSEDGVEKADTYSSRPGHSDHQTGLAIDLNSISDDFGYTPESDWVAENAHKYGFIIRFPKGKEKYTGYQYEPWHIRYLGREKAKEVYESGLSLEEFLGIDSKYDD